MLDIIFCETPKVNTDVKNKDKEKEDIYLFVDEKNDSFFCLNNYLTFPLTKYIKKQVGVLFNNFNDIYVVSNKSLDLKDVTLNTTYKDLQEKTNKKGDKIASNYSELLKIFDNDNSSFVKLLK